MTKHTNPGTGKPFLQWGRVGLGFWISPRIQDFMAPGVDLYRALNSLEEGRSGQLAPGYNHILPFTTIAAGSSE
jgi:hypothetical protein